MPARILIIEDDSASRQLLRYLLETAGHATAEAADGGQGLHMALTGDFDMVLCDLQMPVLNGYEVVQQLLVDSLWRRVPVIAVTAFSMTGDRRKALDAGFDDHITKPIAPEYFVALIEAFLPLEQRTNGSVLR
jgi:two-component system cell cycle response regulator DivK